MADPLLNPRELLPLIPILTGAGATVTDRQGLEPLSGTPLNGARGIVVVHPALHAQVLAKLNA